VPSINSWSTPPGNSTPDLSRSQPLTHTTLPAQHSYLLDQVADRTTPVLSRTDQGEWPGAELYQLLDYLHLEVLRQITDEEWLLFRNYQLTTEVLAPLREQHLALRENIDTLTAASTDTHSPAQLGAAVRQLTTTLHDHIQTEEQLLTAETETPSTTALGATPHTWYALIEGPVIDLNTLPGAPGIDAVTGRLLRLRRGEQLELHASTDPLPLWRRLATSDPGGYGFTYLQQGPPQWRATISRHTRA